MNKHDAILHADAIIHRLTEHQALNVDVNTPAKSAKQLGEFLIAVHKQLYSYYEKLE
jgi:hypothetical protein